MDDVAQAARTIADFLQNFISASGIRVRFRVKLRGAKTAQDEESTETGSVDETGAKTLCVDFSGPDTGLLTMRNGEVLHALEHVAAKMLRLEPDAHDQVSFDADHFKANRDRQMQDSAAEAIERVRLSGRPHAFPPMSSRERRALHMLLAESGLPTASSGEGPGRYVVLYPAGSDTSEPVEEAPRHRPDANRLRNAFRHR